MSGTITVDPSPATRGQSITVKVSGGSAGSITLTATDETGATFTIPMKIGANGSGTATANIPSTWGATLEISGPGLDSYTGTVQEPSDAAAKKKTKKAPAKKPPARSAAKGKTKR